MRNVAEELAGDRIGDDGALVTDDRIVDAGLDEVRAAPRGTSAR